MQNFNPRTPAGCDLAAHLHLFFISLQPTHPAKVRPGLSRSSFYRLALQSTHPYGVRPPMLFSPSAEFRASIRAPPAGCDSLTCVLTRNLLYFSPLAPYEASLPFLFTSYYSLIHAPLRGCGQRIPCGRRCVDLLQSTHPLRGVTRVADIDVVFPATSIHAPLHRRDNCTCWLHCC